MTKLLGCPLSWHPQPSGTRAKSRLRAPVSLGSACGLPLPRCDEEDSGPPALPVCSILSGFTWGLA
eukprot:6818485-Pyramimonas_sp.AAC.1